MILNKNEIQTFKRVKNDKTNKEKSLLNDGVLIICIQLIGQFLCIFKEIVIADHSLRAKSLFGIFNLFDLLLLNLILPIHFFHNTVMYSLLSIHFLKFFCKSSKLFTFGQWI